MAWVCPLCGEINDNDGSWDCADCGKRKPGVPEMDAPPSAKQALAAVPSSQAANGPCACLRCTGVLQPATMSWGPAKVTIHADAPEERAVKVYVCADCGEVVLRAPRE